MQPLRPQPNLPLRIGIFVGLVVLIIISPGVTTDNNHQTGGTGSAAHSHSRHRLVRCSEIQGVSSRVCSVSRRCDDRVMASTTRIQCKYDHRLRELVRSTGDLEQRRERGMLIEDWLNQYPDDSTQNQAAEREIWRVVTDEFQRNTAKKTFIPAFFVPVGWAQFRQELADS